MAVQNVKIGQQITVGATADEIVINETLALMQQPTQTLTIRTATGNAGTIQFAVGEAPVAGFEAVANGQTFTIHGVRPGFRNLWALGSAPGQLFTVF